MELDEKSIEEFCRKQSMCISDMFVQFGNIMEEVLEVYRASFQKDGNIKEEIVDVFVTLMVYCSVCNISWRDIEEEFIRKMVVNNKKPIRNGIGIKVKKT